MPKGKLLREKKKEKIVNFLFPARKKNRVI